MTETRTPNKVELRRELNKLESYATIIGILVGSGIFCRHREVRRYRPTPCAAPYLVVASSILRRGVGEVNEKKGKYYFEWASNRLKLIRAIPKE